jgi:hypothetical protein
VHSGASLSSLERAHAPQTPAGCARPYFDPAGLDPAGVSWHMMLARHEP